MFAANTFILDEFKNLWVPRGSVVKCLTRNPGVLGLASLDPLGFFVGVSLGKTLQSLA